MPVPDMLTAPSTPTNRRGGLPQRFVVAWQHPRRRLIEPIGLLTYDRSAYRFSYIRNALQVKDFRPLLGFADLRATYASKDLFPLFAQRAMDPRRPDYQQYLTRLGFEGEPEPGPLEQIGRSQGRRHGDTIQLLPVPTVAGNDLTFLFLVNGIRHVPDRSLKLEGRETRIERQQVEAALSQLTRGDVLVLVSEPENPVNPLALVVTASSVPVGWLPDLLTEDLHRLMECAKVAVTVEHVNGPGAPWHLRLLARLSASPGADFRFFTGEKWQPLSGEGQ